MRKAIGRLAPTAVAVFFLLGLAPGLSAQEEQQASNVNEIILVEVAPDHEAAFEEGVQQYMDDLGDLGLEVRWDAWQIMTGKHTGDYYVGTFGHSFSDFDETTVDDPEAAEQSARENISPNIQSSTSGIWRTVESLSRPDPDAEGMAPLTVVTFYELKPGMERDFANAVRRLRSAAMDEGWSEYWTLYRLQFGGGPVAALVSGADSWSELQDPDRGLDEVFESATSEYEFEQVREQFYRSLQSVRTEVLQYREDLSYLPGDGGE